jgi:hypothetical protein
MLNLITCHKNLGPLPLSRLKTTVTVWRANDKKCLELGSRGLVEGHLMAKNIFAEDHIL